VTSVVDGGVPLWGSATAGLQRTGASLLAAIGSL